MIHRRVLALTLLAACNGGGGAIEPLHTTIGAAGGTLMIGIGEVSLTVPPGALRQDVAISITTGTSTPIAGWREVGPVYLFAPQSTEFAAPASITLPYSPTKVSSSVLDSEIRIGYRDAAGAVSVIAPLQASDGIATFRADALGTCWVTAPDVVAAADLFPLGDGDEYHFDSGLVLSVERTATEPNLAPLEIAKASFTFDGTTYGTYFDVSQGQLAKLGEFRGEDWQEVFAAPALLLGSRDAIGSLRTATATLQGHIPFGASEIAYHGLAGITTSLAGRQQLRVPLGSFDTVHVVIDSTFTNTFSESGQTRLELWLRKGTGPVALRIGDGPLLMGLVEATVGGNPVIGN